MTDSEQSRPIVLRVEIDKNIKKMGGENSKQGNYEIELSENMKETLLKHFGRVKAEIEYLETLISQAKHRKFEGICFLTSI